MKQYALLNFSTNFRCLGHSFFNLHVVKIFIQISKKKYNAFQSNLICFVIAEYLFYLKKLLAVKFRNFYKIFKALKMDWANNCTLPSQYLLFFCIKQFNSDNLQIICYDNNQMVLLENLQSNTSVYNNNYIFLILYHSVTIAASLRYIFAIIQF